MNNVLEYLEETARTSTWKVAVDDGKLYFTWGELKKIAEKIGTGISKRVKPRTPVVLLMEKSCVTLAAMFGAVYAGAFYVVVDPSQPKTRMEEIFRVLKPGLIVANDDTIEIAAKAGEKIDICFVADLIANEVDEEKLGQIRKGAKREDILYGIFTSGSTGTPKGIVVSHEAVITFINHFIRTFDITGQEIIGNQAPFDFDVSVKDIYTSLFTGAKMVLIPKELFSTPPKLLDYLCEKKVTTIIWAVSALSLVVLLKGLKYRVPTDIKKVMFSGEVMPTKLLRQWQMALSEAEFVNLYGPSEITCNCTYYRVKRWFQDGEKLPIGKPFPGRIVFLQDEAGNEILEKGISGEICVAGSSLANGYYNNPEETQKHFIGLTEQNLEKYYRTGDLGYYGENGELYFAGRIDFQIKHMGHRIELEEIERAMVQVPGVEHCCCLMDEKKNKIVAFYMGEVPSGVIRKSLREKIPVYMIPQKFFLMDQIPLNKNGKTDRGYFKRKLEGEGIENRNS